MVGHSCAGAQPKRCRVRRNVKTTVQLAEGVQGVLDRAPRMEVSSVAAVGAEEQGVEKDEQIAYHIAFRMKQAARKNIYGTKAQQFAEFVGVCQEVIRTEAIIRRGSFSASPPVSRTARR